MYFGRKNGTQRTEEGGEVIVIETLRQVVDEQIGSWRTYFITLTPSWYTFSTVTQLLLREGLEVIVVHIQCIQQRGVARVDSLTCVVVVGVLEVVVSPLVVDLVEMSRSSHQIIASFIDTLRDPCKSDECKACSLDGPQDQLEDPNREKGRTLVMSDACVVESQGVDGHLLGSELEAPNSNKSNTSTTAEFFSGPLVMVMLRMSPYCPKRSWTLFSS